jgi:hypothetical protein
MPFLEKVSAADSICRPVTYKNLIHTEPVVVVVVVVGFIRINRSQSKAHASFFIFIVGAT